MYSMVKCGRFRLSDPYEASFLPMIDGLKKDIWCWVLAPFLEGKDKTIKMNALPRLGHLFQNLPVPDSKKQNLRAFCKGHIYRHFPMVCVITGCPTLRHAFIWWMTWTVPLLLNGFFWRVHLIGMCPHEYYCALNFLQQGKFPATLPIPLRQVQVISGIHLERSFPLCVPIKNHVHPLHF